MTRISSCQLVDMLAEVPDPRKKKGLRHPLASMLALTVVGLLCGQRSYTQIAKWARLHPALRNALGFTAKQTPAASTFHYELIASTRYESLKVIRKLIIEYAK